MRTPKSLRRFQEPFIVVGMAKAKEEAETVTSVECAEVEEMVKAILKLFMQFVYVI